MESWLDFSGPLYEGPAHPHLVQLALDQSLHVTVPPGSPPRSSFLYSGGFTVAPVCNLWGVGNGGAAAHLTAHAMGGGEGS